MGRTFVQPWQPWMDPGGAGKCLMSPSQTNMSARLVARLFSCILVKVVIPFQVFGENDVAHNTHHISNMQHVCWCIWNPKPLLLYVACCVFLGSSVCLFGEHPASRTFRGLRFALRALALRPRRFLWTTRSPQLMRRPLMGLKRWGSRVSNPRELECKGQSPCHKWGYQTT